MELDKSILFLLIPSLLSFFSEVICVPCNAGNSASPDCLGPALSFASSAPIESPLPSPVSSPSPISSPSPSPVSSTETESSPSPSPVSSPQPVSSPSSPDSPTNAQPLLPYSPSVHNAVLTKICGATRFQAECLATIAPYQTGATDPISVIEMGIQALHKDFEEAVATVTKLSKDTALSATIRDSLDICVESYESGITDLNDALTAISTHDTYRLTQMLGAVASYPETCKDAFLEQGEESPLKEVDQKLDILASITVDITILLPGIKIME
ncbi:hypothetical protein SADUNF_Sadunf14G0088500 [Salix dunnii]|uniref:Pectinesterase inhibitor domain-containing protein n=1 Tax=Salix dunnii TaxID=1413687 RepID=A0A835JGH5_9ROSI|nr:hypothetical protein SADUNF_Sadunf14G0088500 [Salix dunnii]